MTGIERVQAVLSGKEPDRIPFVPIIHAGLAGMFNVPLGRFFTDARAMSDVIVKGFQTFGYDGVQLSLGVTAEPEALGAEVEQPDNAPPILKGRLLEDPANLEGLREIDIVTRGRFPMFREAVERVVEAIGNEAFVIVTLRGPFLMAAQLRGVENALMDMIVNTQALCGILDFTTDTSARLGCAFADTGAHAVILGEATCSPSFISPAAYRGLIRERHQLVIRQLKENGWRTLGLHICGNLTPILEDVLTTGADLVDVDHQVSPLKALDLNNGRAVLRGNLDPSGVFAFGTEEALVRQTSRLKEETEGRGCWIYGSGCDISPGSPARTLRRVAELLRE